MAERVIEPPVSGEVLRSAARHGEAFADEVASMAAELLRAREALAAADRLAERAYGHWSTHRLAVEYRAARSAS